MAINSKVTAHIIILPYGGYILTECPNCGGAFTVSTEKSKTVCNPTWCHTKQEPHDTKKVEQWLKDAGQKEDAK